MKQPLISYLFPLSLCTLLGISGFILNIITDIEPNQISKYHHGIEVIATFSNASIFRYNKNGLIEHKINAQKIEQLSNNKYVLYNANIKKYQNNSLTFSSNAANIKYDPITGNLDLNKNNQDKIKIIFYDKQQIYNQNN